MKTFPHDNAEFDFIVQTDAFGAEDVIRCAGNEKGCGRFQEKERLFGAYIIELSDVVSAVQEYYLQPLPATHGGLEVNIRIVPADADDLPAVLSYGGHCC